MTSPLYVAMLIHDYLPHIGGAERQLATLAPALMDRGIKMSVLTRGRKESPAFERMGGVDVHRATLLPGKPFASLAYTTQTLAALMRIKPDLLHVHGLFGTMTTGLAARATLGLPLVAKLLRGGPGLGDIDRLRAKILGQKRLQAIARQVESFVAISPDLIEELEAIGVERSRCHLIPNGVDIDRFRPAEAKEKTALRRTLDLPENAPVVLFSGRLEQEKRVDHLLTAWPMVLARHPEASLVIVGDGSQAAGLRQAAPARTRFTGAIEDVTPWLRAADIFTLPSLAEGLSNAVLEALASGLPAAVLDIPGNRHLITHQETGLLLPTDDGQSLADTLADLMDTPEQRERLGSAGRNLIEQRYSLDRTADRLVELYHRALDAGSIPAARPQTEALTDG
ncbi:MAG: glycosyltransferase family 4 protein [Geminicoccaceae bacterium]